MSVLSYPGSQMSGKSQYRQTWRDHETIRSIQSLSGAGPDLATGSRPIHRNEGELVDKPGSVEDSHSSGMPVTRHLLQPTRIRHGPCHRIPIWSCSRWGLPCRCCYHHRGALLPHLFTLTVTSRKSQSGLFSVALSVSLHCPGITWHPALWSPDFPPHD